MYKYLFINILIKISNHFINIIYFYNYILIIIQQKCRHKQMSTFFIILNDWLIIFLLNMIITESIDS